MTATDFCYWLQGFFELTNSDELSTDQVKMIKEHLQLTFVKETKFSFEVVDQQTGQTLLSQDHKIKNPNPDKISRGSFLTTMSSLFLVPFGLTNIDANTNNPITTTTKQDEPDFLSNFKHQGSC